MSGAGAGSADVPLQKMAPAGGRSCLFSRQLPQPALGERGMRCAADNHSMTRVWPSPPPSEARLNTMSRGTTARVAIINNS